MSAVPTTAAPTADRTALLALARRLALPVLFVAACLYQYLQARAHVTPTVFSDELLYAKLAQSIAAGHGLAIRGAHYAFPAPVAPLLQAPAWLFASMTEGYAAAKLLNGVVMSAAVFPAYWLARRLVRPSFALLVAAAAVATPAMVYHAYLMSEAAAYPLFLLTVALLTKAAAEPSRRLGFAVPAVCLVAAMTRVQFLALPLVYLAAVAVCGRGRWRRYALPVGLLGLLGAGLLLLPRALGSYGNAKDEYRFPVGAVFHWALTNASLLPFSVGLAVVPGALLGVWYGLRSPRARMERAFAAVAVTTTVLFIGQSALISAGEAHRVMERYLFYVTPLVFLAFLLYAERGAPRRVVHVAVAGVFALVMLRVSLPGLTGTSAFFFDSVTESAYARAAYRFGIPGASLLFSAAPLTLAALAALLPLARAAAAQTVALAAIAVQLVAGTGVAATDHLVTSWTQRTLGASPPDWLDRSGLGPARELLLPSTNAGYFGPQLESWNRELRGVVVLQAPAPDAFALSVARVRPDGTLEIDGRRANAQLLVVNRSGTQISLEGKILASPRPELAAYRIPAGAHVRWLATGLFPDRWSSAHLRYQVWPSRHARSGRYAVELFLPRGLPPRHVHFSVGGDRRTMTVRPGVPLHVSMPVRGARPAPLRLSVEVPAAALAGRIVGVRVLALRYVPTR